jgi:hypothetical protein
MEFKKKHIAEIIDKNGDLIGLNDIPTNDANADSVAQGMTDRNLKIGQQPYRYDMLGRFGFTLMPFLEGVEENDGQAALVKDLAELMYNKYMSTIEHYYKNPNKLKSDYRMHSESDFESQPEHNKKIDFDLAKEIIKIVQKHFEDAFDEPEQIDESFDLTMPFDENIKKILKDLLRGSVYEKTGGLDQRIDTLLKINGVWLEKAKQLYSAEEIAKKLIKYEENLNEIEVVEEKILNKRGEDEMSSKTGDNGVRSKKLEKIAGLINKLEKKDIDKLINLLERK